MHRINVIAASYVFVFFATAFADTPIEAGVDKARITADETLTYKLTITSSDKKIPAPQLPGFAGFEVISKSQSSMLSFAKGGFRTVLVYEFILSPRGTGKFKIEASTIKIEGKTYSSNDFEIEVVQGYRPETESGQPQITL